MQLFDASLDYLVVKAKPAEAIRAARGKMSLADVYAFVLPLIRSSVPFKCFKEHRGEYMALRFTCERTGLRGEIGLIFATDIATGLPKPSPDGRGRLVFLQDFHAASKGG